MAKSSEGFAKRSEPQPNSPTEAEAEIFWWVQQTVWVMLLDNLHHPRFLCGCRGVSTGRSGNDFVYTCCLLGGTAFIMESFNCLGIKLDKYFSQSKQKKSLLAIRQGCFRAPFVEQPIAVLNLILRNKLCIINKAGIIRAYGT